MIFDLDRWEEIWATITRNKWRSFMTAMGVFWAIFMFVIMSGAGLALERMLLGSVSTSTNSALVFANGTGEPYKGLPANRQWSPEHNDVLDMRNDIDGIEYISCMVGSQRLNAVKGTQSFDVSLQGYEPENRKISPVEIIYGRYINDIDVLQSRKVCVLGIEVYESLFPNGGDPSGQTLNVGHNIFVIAGVYKTPKSNIRISFGDEKSMVIIPITTMQKIYNYGEEVPGFIYSAKSGYDVEEIQAQVDRRLKSLYDIAPHDTKAIMSINIQKQFLIFENLFLGITILIWIVGMGTLLAGVIGISNIMLIVVKERTQEIGVRRALGAKPKDIIFQIMSESFVLTFITGVAALGVSVGILSLVENMTAGGHGSPINPQITFDMAVGSAVIIIVSGLLAGIIPTVRAISIKAVDAIREE